MLNWLLSSKCRSVPKFRVRLACIEFERRVLLASTSATYTIQLLSPASGVHGDAGASIVSGGLHVRGKYDSDGDGIALVEAHSDIEAVRLAIYGSVTVNTSVIKGLADSTYTFDQMTVGAKNAEHKSFMFSKGKIWLEDLAAYPLRSDWDYNDDYWKVNVKVVPEVATVQWTWRLDEKGRTLAVSGKDDTLNGLIDQGYDSKKLAQIAAKQGINALTKKLAAGIELDVTSFIPQLAQAVLSRQQNMSYEEMRQRVESTTGGPKNIPQGKTVGSCGIEWLQKFESDADGEVIKGTYSDYKFGFGNCYGFVAVMLGKPLPPGASAHDFGIGGLVGEGVAGATETEPMVYNPFQKFLPDPRYDGVRVMVPKGGLIKYLTDGTTVTKEPNFGAVAMFKNKLGVAHAAVVLGHNQKGDVYVVQKLNGSMAYGITTTTDQRIAALGTPTYYQK